MPNFVEILTVGAVGLATTSSSMVGVAIGLYTRFSRRVLASVLALAAGALIGALAIDLAFVGAENLAVLGFTAQAAALFVGGGFALGAIIYYVTSKILERHGAAVRSASRFSEYAVARRQEETQGLIELLAGCSVLCHLPPESIESLLASVITRRLNAGDIVFRTGDPGDALYIVARGTVEVLAHGPDESLDAARIVDTMGQGQVFGEIALLSGGVRTATIRAVGPLELLEINKSTFDAQIQVDPVMAEALARLVHDRAVNRLGEHETNPKAWIKLAGESLDRISESQARRLLATVGQGAGLAIVFGNILDTIPGCLVIGAHFKGVSNMSITLMLGMFFGGIPEAAVSTVMLRKAGYSSVRIVCLWLTVLIAGIVAAITGKLVLGDAESLLPIFAQALAGGAVLALVAHTMIPEAIHEGGSVTVLPTVAGFLFALYFALVDSTVFMKGTPPCISPTAQESTVAMPSAAATAH